LLEGDGVKAVDLLAHLVLGDGGLAVRIGGEGLLYSAAGWERLKGQVAVLTNEFHRAYPLRAGLPREELRNRLKLKAVQFQAVVLDSLGDTVSVTVHFNVLDTSVAVVDSTGRLIGVGGGTTQICLNRIAHELLK